MLLAHPSFISMLPPPRQQHSQSLFMSLFLFLFFSLPHSLFISIFSITILNRSFSSLLLSLSSLTTHLYSPIPPPFPETVMLFLTCARAKPIMQVRIPFFFLYIPFTCFFIHLNYSLPFPSPPINTFPYISLLSFTLYIYIATMFFIRSAKRKKTRYIKSNLYPESFHM